MERELEKGSAAVPEAPVLAYLSGAPRVATDPRSSAAGPRAHVLGVMKAFERRGWRVRPFIVGDRIPGRARRGGDRIAARPGRLSALGADLLRWTTGRVAPLAARRALGRDLDLVYERFASMQALGRGFQKRGTPWVLETNGPFFYEAEFERRSMVLSGLARRMELAAYRDCDVLVCVSRPLRDIVVEEAGIPEEKVLVVPNAVDPDRFDPSRLRPRRRTDALTVGFAGSLLEWQGLDLLLEALARIRREGHGVEATIVGDGPALPHLRRLSARLDLEGAVRFVGAVPWSEIPGYLSEFDVAYSGQKTMAVGRMYHSPLKLYEYMAMGLPILAAAHDDAAVLAGGGSRGLLFRPDDVEDLIVRLREVVGRRDELAGMGRAARTFVLEHHTWDVRVTRMVKGIREILR